MNYYEKHIGDYIRDTVSLTMTEDGAYNRMIDQVYQSEKPLPLDKKLIYRLARAGSTADRKAVDFVLSSFFQETAEGYIQKRVQQEIERYQGKQRKAKASADARWSKVKPDANASETHDASDMRTHSEGNAHQTPDTSNQTPDLKAKDNDDATVPDFDPPHVAPLPTREAPPLSNDPAIQIGVALRRLGVNAPFTHPAVQDWATNRVSIELLTEAVAIARMSKGEGAKIPPNYLIPIVADLVNPPAAAPGKPSAAPHKPRKPQGMDPKGLDESYDDYNARITKAEAERRKGQP